MKGDDVTMCDILRLQLFGGVRALRGGVVVEVSRQRGHAAPPPRFSLPET
jgi:hypothetical protein